MSHVNLTELVPLGAAIYARHRAGCCLHVVLDDDNVDDDSVRHCAVLAAMEQHDDCAKLAAALGTMSKTQRRKLVRLISSGAAGTTRPSA